MSHTVSTGYHKASRWVGPALAIEESLSKNAVPPLGALHAMERFFTWMLSGIGLQEGQKPDQNIRSSAAWSAFFIGRDVFSSIYPTSPPLHRMRIRGQAYFNILVRIRTAQRIPEIGWGKGEVERLQIFLRELIRQGEVEQNKHLVLL